MVYDGDCNFCGIWVRRWRFTTGDQVEYVPFQDPRVAERFPEIPRDRYEKAVHLIETDGSVYSGAEAAFRTLARNPRDRWLLDWYLHSPLFERLSERAYEFVAKHREFFSILTRIAWGQHAEPSTYVLARWIFLRSLALIYLVAFISLWVQVDGLVGDKGILPAKTFMAEMRQRAETAKIGWQRYHILPTLCWFDASERFVHAQCAAGVGLAIMLLIGIAPAPCLFLLWLIYLSLSVVCREFLGFQWDILLLETGFLAIFLAPPLQFLPRFIRGGPPSRVALWLLRFLLFKLMFESGSVKLLSGDATWRNLSALHFHFETQPLPTWIGWYAHQLPAWVQKGSTALMFGIELVLPFFIFTPRRIRYFVFWFFVALQAFIMMTGNYCFFNLLTIALCMLLLDDLKVQKLFSAKWRTRLPIAAQAPSLISSAAYSRLRGWPRAVTIPVMAIAMAISLMQASQIFRIQIPWPRPVLSVYQWISPFRTFNNYGLFAIMTTRRQEIIVEGSEDGVTWREYEFKYKPGDVKRRPKFVEPHQPRLDWQMWFAALSDYRQNPWFVSFCLRLLQGSPEVLALLERNPFSKAPPRYVRAQLYEYHFSDFATRRKTGAWWQRELQGPYIPVISLREQAVASSLAEPTTR